MKKFLLSNNEIIFNDAQEDEINLFKELFLELLPMINGKFGKEFLSIKIDTKEEDLEWAHMEYMDKLKELLVNSCSEITNTLFLILQNNNVYTYDKTEIESTVDICIEFGLEFIHPYYHEEDNINIIKDLKKFNEFLKNDPLEKETFLYNLCIEIALHLRSTILDEIFGEDTEYAFDDEDIYEYMVYNNLKKTRNNIESIGLNNNNISEYLDTFKKAPFNISRYFYLIKEIGDTKLEIDNLFKYVFGSNSLLIKYKQKYLNELIDKSYKNRNVKKMNETDLKKFLKFLDNECIYFGLNVNQIPLYLRIADQLSDIERTKRTVEGVEYSTSEEANDVREELNKIRTMVNNESLVELQKSINEIKKIDLYSEQAKKELKRIDAELENYKNECKNWEATYKKNIKKFCIILVVALLICSVLLVFGFIGIGIDIFVVLALIGDYDEKVSKVKKRKKEYEDYCRIFENL